MGKVIKIPLIQGWLNYRKNGSGYIAKLIEEHGDIFRVEFTLFGFSLLKADLLMSGSCIKNILFDKSENYIKTPFAYEHIADAIGKEAIFVTNDYDLWKRDRGLLNPIFSEMNIKTYAENIVKTTKNSLESWEDFIVSQKPMNMYNAIQFAAFQNELNTLFGGIYLDFSYIRNLLRKLDSLVSSDARLLAIFKTPLLKYRIRKCRKQLKGVCDDIMAQCLSQSADSANIVKVLYDHYKSNNMEEDEIKKNLYPQIITFLSGAHEGLSGVLVQTLVYLSLFPFHAQKIREEIKNTIGSRDPSVEDLSQLSYTRAVLQETLRLRPTVGILLRTAIEDAAIGEYTIKKGDTLFISIYHLHRIEKYWPNPEGFDPERFLKPLDEQYKFLYLPFSIGPRSCIGQHFAMMEMMIMLVMIMQRYQLFLTSSSTLESERYTLHYKINMQVAMTVHRLEGGNN